MSAGQAEGPWPYAKTDKQTSKPKQWPRVAVSSTREEGLEVWSLLVHALDCLLGLSGGFLFLGAFDVWGEPVTRSGQ